MKLPKEIEILIASYLVDIPTKLLHWIPLYKLDWISLSSNPNALHLLEKNLDKIYWTHISRNPSIFEFDKKEYERKIEHLISFF